MYMYKTMAMEQFQTQIHVPDNKVVFTVIDSMTGEIVQTGTFEQAMDYECSEDSKELLSATVKTEKEDIDSDALDKEQNIISDTDWRDFGLDVVKKETSQEHTPTLQTSTEFEPLILDVFCKDEIEFEQQKEISEETETPDKQQHISEFASFAVKQSRSKSHTKQTRRRKHSEINFPEKNNTLMLPNQGVEHTHLGRQVITKLKRKIEANVGHSGKSTISELQKILEAYKTCNIYMANLTGLYYRAIPDTLVDKGDNMDASMALKEMITILVAVNMTGKDRRPLLVIGNSNEPPCFGKVNYLPVEYHYNDNALMNSNIFMGWIKKFNIEMRRQKKKVLLLVDNCNAHLNSTCKSLTNVYVFLLPPNSCEHGIVRNLKAHYRSNLLKNVTTTVESPKVKLSAAQVACKISLLDALHDLRKAWSKVKASTIKNCFKKVGIIHPNIQLQKDKRSIRTPPNMSETSFDQFVDIDSALPCSVLPTGHDVYKEKCVNLIDKDGSHSKFDKGPENYNIQTTRHIEDNCNTLSARGQKKTCSNSHKNDNDRGINISISAKNQEHVDNPEENANEGVNSIVSAAAENQIDSKNKVTISSISAENQADINDEDINNSISAENEENSDTQVNQKDSNEHCNTIRAKYKEGCDNPVNILKFSVTSRKRYTAAFKLECVDYAKEKGNKATARHYSINISTVRDWRKQENLLRMTNKTRRMNCGSKKRNKNPIQIIKNDEKACLNFAECQQKCDDVVEKEMSVTSRKSYTAAFKLECVDYAKEKGNRATARHYSINESIVRLWRKQENLLLQTKKTKRANRGSNKRNRNKVYKNEEDTSICSNFAERQQDCKNVFGNEGNNFSKSESPELCNRYNKDDKNSKDSECNECQEKCGNQMNHNVPYSVSAEYQDNCNNKVHEDNCNTSFAGSQKKTCSNNHKNNSVSGINISISAKNQKHVDNPEENANEGVNSIVSAAAENQIDTRNKFMISLISAENQADINDKDIDHSVSAEGGTFDIDIVNYISAEDEDDENCDTQVNQKDSSELCNTIKTKYKEGSDNTVDILNFSVTSRKSYTAAFKLQCVDYAKERGNRTTARHYSINESIVRAWRKQENLLRLTNKTKRANRGSKKKNKKPIQIIKNDEKACLKFAECQQKCDDVVEKEISVTSRKSYTAAFKLECVDYAKEKGNRATARHYSINESIVRLWRKQENLLLQIKKTKRANRGGNKRNRNNVNKNEEDTSICSNFAECQQDCKNVFGNEGNNFSKSESPELCNRYNKDDKNSKDSECNECQEKCGNQMNHEVPYSISAEYQDNCNKVHEDRLDVTENVDIHVIGSGDKFNTIKPSKRKRNDIVLAEKYEAIRLLDKGVKRKDVCLELKISQAQCSRIYSKKDEICKAIESNSNVKRKHFKHGKDPEVEKALIEWYNNARLWDLPISCKILADKAKDLAKQLNKPDFQPTTGWLARWKERNNIIFGHSKSEKRDACTIGVDEWTSGVLPYILKSYKPCDIYNAGETCLYYRAIPVTLDDKSDNVACFRKSEDRITALVAVNMTGDDKRPPLVIGSVKYPRSFNDNNHLPLEYHANDNALMTSNIFCEWVKKFDEDMRRQKRKVILLVETCSAHQKIACKSLTNVHVRLLPPNITTKIHPCEQGVIRDLKAHYRSTLVKNITKVIESTEEKPSASQVAHKISLLDALHKLKKAWSLVPATTIVHCFRKSGLITADIKLTTSYNSDISLTPPNMSDTSFAHFVDMDSAVPCVELPTDQDICNSVLSERQQSIKNPVEGQGYCDNPAVLLESSDKVAERKRNDESSKSQEHCDKPAEHQEHSDN